MWEAIPIRPSISYVQSYFLCLWHCFQKEKNNAVDQSKIDAVIAAWIMCSSFWRRTILKKTVQKSPRWQKTWPLSWIDWRLDLSNCYMKRIFTFVQLLHEENLHIWCFITLFCEYLWRYGHQAGPPCLVYINECHTHPPIVFMVKPPVIWCITTLNVVKDSSEENNVKVH